MLEKMLFCSYLLSLSAIIRNATRFKLQDDLHEELQALREYDLSTERITSQSQLIDSGKDVIVLVKT